MATSGPSTEAVASVIAVLQLSETVLNRCYRYVGRVKEASADIDRVIRQIIPLSAPLQDLDDLSKSGGARAAKSTRNLSCEHGPLSICAQCLEELKAKLPSGPVTLCQKLQWPFELKKTADITERIAAQIPLRGSDIDQYLLRGRGSACSPRRSQAA